jgi:hypothetical protein
VTERARSSPDPYQNAKDPEHWKKLKVTKPTFVGSGGGAEGKESKKERKARKRMLKKQQEKEEGMDKLSKKQKSKIRSKAMVGTFYSSSCWWENTDLL